MRAWQLRMPVVRGPARRARSDAGLPSLVGRAPRVVGFVDAGAVARPVTPDVAPGDAPRPSAWHRRLAAYERRTAPATLRLVAYDSLAGRALPGARVWLRQLADSAALLFEAGSPVSDGAGPGRSTPHAADTIVTTGADGAADVAGLPAGAYEARWTHDELLPSQLEPAPRRLALAAGAAVVDSAATASFATHWRACGAVPAGRVGRETGGVARGVVRRAEDGAPVTAATVTVRWPAIPGIRETSAAAVTTSRGEWAVCGVPVGSDLLVDVTVGGRRAPPIPLVIDARRVARRELWTGATP